MHKPPTLRSRTGRPLALLLLLAFLLPADARAQFQIIGSSVAPAFREVTAAASRSTVIIESDGKAIALGTIVAADGWILTKASELSGRITCRIGKRELDARVVSVADEYDLAMLKVDATNLTPVRFSDSSAAVGRWVASAGTGDLPVGAGVVSVAARRIASRDVMLGVSLADAPGGVRVLQVSPESGAEKAGLRTDDIITAIDGRPVKASTELIDAVAMRQVNDSVKLTVLRGKDELNLSAALGKRSSSGSGRSERMNTMGGPLSRRRAGFPIALQHDTVLKPEQCGGPLVDLDGQVIGINIARAGRTESYAVPASVLAGVIEDLKSGKRDPAEPSKLTSVAE